MRSSMWQAIIHHPLSNPYCTIRGWSLSQLTGRVRSYQLGHLKDDKDVQRRSTSAEYLSQTFTEA